MREAAALQAKIARAKAKADGSSASPTRIRRKRISIVTTNDAEVVENNAATSEHPVQDEHPELQLQPLGDNSVKGEGAAPEPLSGEPAQLPASTSEVNNHKPESPSDQITSPNHNRANSITRDDLDNGSAVAANLAKLTLSNTSDAHARAVASRFLSLDPLAGKFDDRAIECRQCHQRIKMTSLLDLHNWHEHCQSDLHHRTE